MIEAFVCSRIAGAPRLTRTSCAARHRAVGKGGGAKWGNGGGVYQPECEDCEVGKAHARGEQPAEWPDGTPLALVQLRAAAAPPPSTPPLREEPPEPTPALPPSQDVRGAPREAEVERDQERDVQSAKDELDRRLDKFLLSVTAPSEERSEPPADPQTSPAPAAPRGARSKTYAHAGKELTLSQWMRQPEVAALGISLEGVRQRLKKDWPIGEALTTPKGAKPRSYGPAPTRYPFHGEQLTVAEVAALPEVQALGLTDRTIRKRLRSGCTMEEAATTPKATRSASRGHAEKHTPQREPASTAATLGADLQRTLDDAQRRFGPAVTPPATAHPRERVERLLDLQVEVRAQLRALAGPGTPHDLADVYAAAAAELAAYQAIRGGRA